MSDREHDSKQSKSLPLAKEGADTQAGEGARSLANWERLAAARRDLASNEQSRAAMKADPSAFLAGFGINAQAFSSTAGGKMGLTSLERQLAFSGGVDREALGTHRIASLIVGPVALAIAGVVAGVAAEVGAVIQVYAANFAFTANVIQSANWVEGVGAGD